MTASLHRLGAGAEAGLYYTNDSQREARPDRRDEYYLADGGGVWWSSGDSVVRHGAAIDAASFRDLCAGIHPATGKPLVRGAGSGHWAGQDCTLTPGKSVSVLWMAGSPEQRAAIEAENKRVRSREEAFEDELRALELEERRLELQAKRARTARANDYIDAELRDQAARTDVIQSEADSLRNVTSGTKALLEDAGQAEVNRSKRLFD